MQSPCSKHTHTLFLLSYLWSVAPLRKPKLRLSFGTDVHREIDLFQFASVQCATTIPLKATVSCMNCVMFGYVYLFPCFVFFNRLFFLDLKYYLQLRTTKLHFYTWTLLRWKINTHRIHRTHNFIFGFGVISNRHLFFVRFSASVIWEREKEEKTVNLRMSNTMAIDFADAPKDYHTNWGRNNINLAVAYTSLVIFSRN